LEVISNKITAAGIDMAKALVVYATRTGETRQIAELIAEGIRFGGHEAEVVEAKKIKSESDLENYDAYAFGSPTYHGEMLQTMKTFLFIAEKVDLANKPGGAFGSYGWSGEANDRIFNTMKHIFKMDLVGDTLRLKSSSLGGGLKMAQDYGREIAKKLGS
jgi:flavorubredoxin